MNTQISAPISVAAASAERRKAETVQPHRKSNLRFRTLLSLPVAILIALAVRILTYKKGAPVEMLLYNKFLLGLLGGSVLAEILQPFWSGLRNWMQRMWPIFAAAVVSMAAWQLITTGLRWLPLPYFPGPEGVLQSMVNDLQFDRKAWQEDHQLPLLLDSTWNSLLLLASGYALGVAVALVTGVCIGWFSKARYWGMPMLKVVGPIPATAWVPLAMVVSPSARFSAIGLIALAVWFPVTMLTVSGIANTRASYLDVARTLGAKPSYLIFRVAIPAALPNIFIGLFMGLGTSFLTLIVAETVGVKSGLGWYVSWAQGWAEYGKVYAALIIMAVFFSTIMTLLFKVRDRVLAWQKGTIKW